MRRGTDMDIMRNIIGSAVMLLGFAVFGVTNVSDLVQEHDILWNQLGPSGGGWYESVAFSPDNPDTICVGTDVGGFLISFDGGQTFEARNNGLTDYFIERIAIHPSNANIIILATAGGIFRTTDQGETWIPMGRGTGTPFPLASTSSYSAPMNVVCFDPQNSNTIFAGQGRTRGDLNNGNTRSGKIYKSTDCGVNWSLISTAAIDPSAIINDIAVKPDNDSFVLVATDKGMYRSNDGGTSWAAANNGLGSNINISRIAFAPQHPTTLYITVKTMARDGQTWDGGIYRSNDAGQSWINVTGNFPKTVGSSTDNECLTTSPKDIVVDPNDINCSTVFVANYSWINKGIYKTINSASWTNLINNNINTSGWAEDNIGAIFAFAMCLNDPNRLIALDSMQMFLTADGGATWDQNYCAMLTDGYFKGNGANILCASDIVFDAINPNRIYFCYLDTALLISDDKGKTYRRAKPTNSDDVFTVAVDGATIWAASSNDPKLQISNDDGATWTSCVAGLPTSPGNIQTIILDPAGTYGNRRLLITVAGSGVYQSSNNGSSWNCINGNLSSLTAITSPRGLLLDPKNNQHMILALGGNPGDGAGVYETTNSGALWSKLNSTIFFNDIQVLRADPKFFKVLYIGQRYKYVSGLIYDGGVFQSTDGGITWTQLLEGDLCSDVKVNPADSNVLYALFTSYPYHDNDNGQGVVKSYDRGLTWHKEWDGLPIFNIHSIGINPVCPEDVYIGTHGSASLNGFDKCTVPHARWKLDEAAGSIALDSSGFSRNGTISGSFSRVAGVSGVANNAIQLTNAGKIVLSRTNAPSRCKGITVAAWTNMGVQGTNVNSYVMYKTSSYQLKQGWNRETSFAVYVQNTRYSTPTYTVPLGQWVHLAGSYSEETKTIKLYVNGTCVKSYVITAPLISYAIDDNNNDVVTSVGTGSRTVSLDDIRLYNYAIDDAKIKEMADQDMFINIPFEDPETSVTITNASYGCDGSLSGTSSYVFNNLNGKALALQSTSAVTVPASSMPACQDAVSICGWIYIASDATQNNSNVFDKAYSYSLRIGWYRSLAFKVYVNGAVYSSATFTLQTGQWYYVVGTYGAADKTIRLYVNGVLQAPFTLPTGLTTYQIDTNANNGTISTNGLGGRLTRFDNIMVYKRVLSQEEITALYE